GDRHRRALGTIGSIDLRLRYPVDTIPCAATRRPARSNRANNSSTGMARTTTRPHLLQHSKRIEHVVATKRQVTMENRPSAYGCGGTSPGLGVEPRWGGRSAAPA